MEDRGNTMLLRKLFCLSVCLLMSIACFSKSSKPFDFKYNDKYGNILLFKIHDDKTTVSCVGVVPETDGSRRWIAGGEVSIPDVVYYKKAVYIVTEIGNYAFARLSLLNVEYPNGLQYIGDGAFMGNQNLGQMIIPNHVIRIGSSAFSYCGTRRPPQLSLPSDLEEIGDSAFYGVGIDILEVPRKVKKIGKYAFSNSTTTTVVLKSVPVVEEGAFEMQLLKEFAMDKQGTFDIKAFGNCNYKNRYAIYLKDLESCGGDVDRLKRMYAERDAVKNFTGQGSKEYVGRFCFEFINGKKSREGRPGVRLIRGKYTFSGPLVIPGSVEILGTTFDVISIGEGAFAYNEITSVDIPNTVEHIYPEAFLGCGKLRSVQLPAFLASIGYQSFAFCDNLQIIHFPPSLETIYDSAFKNCSKLKYSKIYPNTDVNVFAFSGCPEYEAAKKAEHQKKMNEIANRYVSKYPKFGKDIILKTVNALDKSTPYSHNNLPIGAPLVVIQEYYKEFPQSFGVLKGRQTFDGVPDYEYTKEGYKIVVYDDEDYHYEFLNGILKSKSKIVFKY